MPLDDASGLDSILKQVGSLSDTIGKETAPQQAEMRALEKRGREALTSLEQETTRKLPEPPRLGALPKAPDVQPDNPMEALGQPLTVLSIFASLLTKAPLTSALESAGNAIAGFHQGRMDAARLAYEQYQTAMDQVFKQHEAEMSDYRALMEEHGNTIRGKAAVLEAIGAAHGWQEVSRLAKAGQVDRALKIVDMQERSFERIQREKFLEKMFETGKTPQQQVFNDWKRAHPDATPEEEGKFLQSLQKTGTSPQAVALQKYVEEHPDANANDLANFVQKMRPPRSAPAMALQKYIEEHPEASSDDIARYGQDYAARAKAVAAFAAGKQGDIIRFFNTAAAHIGTMEKLADALGNNDAKAFNTIANAWADQFGGTAPNNFNSAKQIVGDEIVKAIVGAGGGVSDREKAQGIFDAARTPQQLKEAMGTVKDLIHGQLTGLKKQYEDTTGRQDFDSRLSGAAKETLLGTGKKRYQKGDIIDTPRGKVRVTGGDPEDPDVEAVK